MAEPEESPIVEERLLTYAEAIAETLEDQYPEIIQRIAVEYARQGQIDHAIDVVQTIDDPYLKDQATGYIAAYCIDEQRFDQSVDLLESIDDPMMLEMAREQVAIHYAQSDNLDDAVAAASQLTNSDSTLGNIATIAASHGFFDDARELVQSIESAYSRASALSQLAFSSLSDNPDFARQLLSDLQQASEQIELNEERVDALLNIAQLQQLVGTSEEASKSFEVAHKLAAELGDEPSETPNLTSSFVKYVALGQMAVGFGKLKSFESADQVLGEIQDPFQFATTATVLADIYRENGDEQQATDLLQQAREIGDEEGKYGEGSARQRDHLFADIAQTAGVSGHFEFALDVAARIESADDRLNAVRSLGESAVRQGLSAKVERASELLPSLTTRVQFWLSVNRVLNEAGQKEDAEAAITKAIAEANSADSDYDNCLALGQIAASLHEIEQTELSDSLFTEAVTNIPIIANGLLRVNALLDLDRKYVKAGKTLTPEERDSLDQMILALD